MIATIDSGYPIFQGEGDHRVARCRPNEVNTNRAVIFLVCNEIRRSWHEAVDASDTSVIGVDEEAAARG